MTAHAPAISSLQRRLRARRRFVLPLLVSFLGLFVTVTTWVRARQERQAQVETAFSSVAETNRLALARRIRLHFSALSNLSRYWQLFGLPGREAWRFDIGMALQHFPGFARIVWVDSAGTDIRFLARDSSETASPELVEEARRHLQAPALDYIADQSQTRALKLYLPVRTPQDSLGVLAGELETEALLGGDDETRNQLLACTIRGSDGRVLMATGEPAADTPAALRRRGVLPLPNGGEWTVEYAPSHAYWATLSSRWPNYFLLTGVLLSFALGALALQFLRLREYSAVLADANRALDARIRELSERDRELSRVNLELESRVAERTAELQDTLRDLETFSHSVSHDLRSPVGSVLNLAAILEEDYEDRLDEEGMRLLGRIRASANAAVRLLNELVQLTWSGRDEPPVDQRVDMAAVARSAFGEAAAADKGAGPVHFELAELPPARGDPSLLERVLANLLSNALKFTRDRAERHIRVEADPGPAEHTYAVVDNGVGFEPGQAGVLFEPFRRGHSGDTYEGTGLGLAIAARIVRRHGGRMWAESDGASGSRFCFTLPASGGAQ